MEIMEMVKFVALYALEVFVIATVGATLLAGLYQLIRDSIRSTSSETGESRVPAPALAQKRK
jgi:hypothetical protein